MMTEINESDPLIMLDSTLILPLDSIREATNKAWVLGDKRFKTKVAKQIDRPVESRGHGGDRKSDGFYDD